MLRITVIGVVGGEPRKCKGKKCDYCLLQVCHKYWNPKKGNWTNVWCDVYVPLANHYRYLHPFDAHIGDTVLVIGNGRPEENRKPERMAIWATDMEILKKGEPVEEEGFLDPEDYIPL